MGSPKTIEICSIDMYLPTNQRVCLMIFVQGPLKATTFTSSSNLSCSRQLVSKNHINTKESLSQNVSEAVDIIYIYIYVNIDIDICKCV